MASPNVWLTGAGRNGSYNDQSPLVVLKGLIGNMLSAGRGAVSATLGLPGDMTRAGYSLAGQTQPAKGETLLPDSSDVRRWLPQLPQDMRNVSYQTLG